MVYGRRKKGRKKFGEGEADKTERITTAQTYAQANEEMRQYFESNGYGAPIDQDLFTSFCARIRASGFEGFGFIFNNETLKLEKLHLGDPAGENVVINLDPPKSLSCNEHLEQLIVLVEAAGRKLIH